MRPDQRYYDVAPVVVPSDAVSTIVIRPRHSHVALRPGASYEAQYYPCEEIASTSDWPSGSVVPCVPAGDGLAVRAYFEGEQEHVLRIRENQGADCRQVSEVRVYSVAADLMGRLPLKGDLHMHSAYSDGRESPAYVAAACRRVGLDFMAITDHRQYEPSLEAIEAYRGVPLDLRIYPGEEVHPPDSPVHIVNFGGAASINALFADTVTYRSGVNRIAGELGPLPPGVDAYQHASAIWCFRRIREAGGLAVFCHPYWFTDYRYAPAGALTSKLLVDGPFDAYEVIGGYHLHEVFSNALQVARYHEERAAGRVLPIVGVSDAHGCERNELFGWYYTIVFSPSNELPALIDSVKGLYSVAVEALPNQEPRPYGPFRLVKYALFLMREVFPIHDELCVEEGRLMTEHAAGDGDAREALARLHGRTPLAVDRLLGRN